MRSGITRILPTPSPKEPSVEKTGRQQHSGTNHLEHEVQVPVQPPLLPRRASIVQRPVAAPYYVLISPYTSEVGKDAIALGYIDQRSGITRHGVRTCVEVLQLRRSPPLRTAV